MVTHYWIVLLRSITVTFLHQALYLNTKTVETGAEFLKRTGKLSLSSDFLAQAANNAESLYK